MNTWILRVLGMILPLITPELKKGMCQFITELKERAAKTDNPWDDIIVDLLDDLFCPK